MNKLLLLLLCSIFLTISALENKSRDSLLSSIESNDITWKKEGYYSVDGWSIFSHLVDYEREDAYQIAKLDAIEKLRKRIVINSNLDYKKRMPRFWGVFCNYFINNRITNNTKVITLSKDGDPIASMAVRTNDFEFKPLRYAFENKQKPICAEFILRFIKFRDLYQMKNILDGVLTKEISNDNLYLHILTHIQNNVSEISLQSYSDFLKKDNELLDEYNEIKYLSKNLPSKDHFLYKTFLTAGFSFVSDKKEQLEINTAILDIAIGIDDLSDIDNLKRGADISGSSWFSLAQDYFLEKKYNYALLCLRRSLILGFPKKETIALKKEILLKVFIKL